MSHIEHFLMDHNCRRILRPYVLKGVGGKGGSLYIYPYIHKIHSNLYSNIINISLNIIESCEYHEMHSDVRNIYSNLMIYFLNIMKYIFDFHKNKFAYHKLKSNNIKIHSNVRKMQSDIIKYFRIS